MGVARLIRRKGWESGGGETACWLLRCRGSYSYLVILFLSRRRREGNLSETLGNTLASWLGLKA